MADRKWFLFAPPEKRGEYEASRVASSLEKLRVIAYILIPLALALAVSHSINPGHPRDSFLYWYFHFCFAFYIISVLVFLGLEKAVKGPFPRKVLLSAFSSAVIFCSALLTAADNVSDGDPGGYIIALVAFAIFLRFSRTFTFGLYFAASAVYCLVAVTVGGKAIGATWIILSFVYSLVAFFLAVMMDFYDLRAFFMENSLRESSAELGKSAKERELLLRELRHRVGNNLSLVSSLLSLESGRASSEEVKAVFTKMRLQIDTVARMYDLLYFEATTTRVKASHYFREITQAIKRGYASDKVTIETKIDEFDLDSKTAIPLGIVINELATDSIKYAFPGDRTGRLRIEILLHDETVKILVKDDGIGFPAGFEWKASKGLGFQIIRMLIEQVNGTVEIDGSNGLTTSISIPLAKDHPIQD